MITPEIISRSSPEFRELLKMSCLYLAAADGQFTGPEQDWIDRYFGTDASGHFLEEYTSLNWDLCFKTINSNSVSLSQKEKEMLDQGLRIWLLELLSVDGVTNEELEQLDGFMTFIEGAKTNPATSGISAEIITTRAEMSACAKCGSEMEPDQILCITCGFNSRSGQTIKMQTGKAELSPPGKPQQNVNYHPNVPSDAGNEAWESEPTETIYETEESSGGEGLLLYVMIMAVLFGFIFWYNDGFEKEGGMSGTWVSDPSGQAEMVSTLHLGQDGKITLKTVNNLRSFFHDEGIYWLKEGPPRKIIFKVKKSNGGMNYVHKKEFLILDDGNLEGYGDLILKKQ